MWHTEGFQIGQPACLSLCTLSCVRVSLITHVLLRVFVCVRQCAYVCSFVRVRVRNMRMYFRGMGMYGDDVTCY